MKPSEKSENTESVDANAEARAWRRIVDDRRRGRGLRIAPERFVNDTPRDLDFPVGAFTNDDPRIPDHLRSGPPPVGRVPVPPAGQILLPEGTIAAAPAPPAWRAVPDDPDVPHVAELILDVLPRQKAIEDASRRIATGNDTLKSLLAQAEAIELEIGRAEGRQAQYTAELSEARRKFDELLSGHSEKWKLAALTGRKAQIEPIAAPPVDPPEGRAFKISRDGVVPVQVTRSGA